MYSAVSNLVLGATFVFKPISKEFKCIFFHCKLWIKRAYYSVNVIRKKNLVHLSVAMSSWGNDVEQIDNGCQVFQLNRDIKDREHQLQTEDVFRIKYHFQRIMITVSFIQIGKDSVTGVILCHHNL